MRSTMEWDCLQLLAWWLHLSVTKDGLAKIEADATRYETSAGWVMCCGAPVMLKNGIRLALDQ